MYVYAVIITPKYYRNLKNIFKIFKNLGDLDAISLRYYYYIIMYKNREILLLNVFPIDIRQ